MTFIADMLEQHPDATSPADRLRAVFGELMDNVPAMVLNATKLLPGVGGKLQLTREWVAGASDIEATEVLDMLREAVDDIAGSDD